MRAIASLLVSFALVATTTTPAAAASKAGVTMPDQIQVMDKQLHLNGMGLREATWLKVDVYVAGLYLERASSDPAQVINSDQVKRLELRFVRDVDREDVSKAWRDGFKSNAIVPREQIQSRISRLESWMEDFSDGETLAFTYVPGRGVIVDVGKTRKGVIEGDDFARSLFAIWLGSKPPTTALKKGLLGSHAA